jgi:hypothetical protein
LPVVHVEKQKRDTNLCLEALYWCDLVNPGDGPETMVFDPLELFSLPIMKEWRRRGGPPWRIASGDSRAHNRGVEMPRNPLGCAPS